MKRLLILFALACMVTPQVLSAQDRVTPVDSDDRAMNSAIKEARRQLPHFWATFGAPKHGETDFCLKVKIEDRNGVEHFWCTDIERSDGRIWGVIANDPTVVERVSAGQRVSIEEKQISDWLYFRDGKMIGNYTLRVLMKTAPESERRQLEEMLGPLP